MKAILVIDVPVNDTIDFGHMDIRANIEVKAYNDLDFKSYELQHIKVEPLPEISKKRLDSLKTWEWTELELLMYETGFDDCIGKILSQGVEE